MRKLGMVMLLMALGFNTVSTAQKKLFNGKDLTGWEVYGTERWYVEDGLLVCESGPDQE